MLFDQVTSVTSDATCSTVHSEIHGPSHSHFFSIYLSLTRMFCLSCLSIDPVYNKAHAQNWCIYLFSLPLLIVTQLFIKCNRSSCEQRKEYLANSSVEILFLSLLASHFLSLLFFSLSLFFPSTRVLITFARVNRYHCSDKRPVKRGKLLHKWFHLQEKRGRKKCQLLAWEAQSEKERQKSIKEQTERERKKVTSASK